MTSVRGQRVFLGQASGPDVELVVTGSPLYATYETVDGHPVLYDAELGLYCFAVVVDGKFVSTHAPITGAVPEGVVRHARESDAVRLEKTAARATRKQPRGRGTAGEGEPK